MSGGSPCYSALLMLMVITLASALPPSLLHDVIDQTDRSAVAAAASKVSTDSTSSSTPVPVKSDAVPSTRPKQAPLDKAYKLHANGLTKRNENSIIKRNRQLYSEPPGAEYRFFRRDDSDRRRRSTRLLGNRNLGRFPGVVSRNKRDLPSRLDADDALALLALWASAASAPPHRLPFADTDYRYDLPDDDEIIEEELQRQEQEQTPDGWGGEEEYGDRLNVMRRGGPMLYPILPTYQQHRPSSSSELGWGEFAPPTHKRLLVAKRRLPQNDVYSLAQLLSDHSESPYRRFML